MPIFEYRCNSCGQVTEKLAPNPEEFIECPCKGRAERKLSLFNCRIWSRLFERLSREVTKKQFEKDEKRRGK